MKLFEYEAKEILGRYGLGIPAGRVTMDPAEAETIAAGFGGPVVIKAQVQVSGRGKAGGIVFADSPQAAGDAAAKLVGSRIKDIPVEIVLIEEKLDLVDQLYASVTVDRQERKFVVLLSTSGGVDIEEVASATPDKILRHWVEPTTGFDVAAARNMVKEFGLSEGDTEGFAKVAATLYTVAMDFDAELVELNPLAKTSTGAFVAADARIIIDENAIFRHPEFEQRDMVRTEDTPREAVARRQGLAYVELDGNIGIVGNGAGLVMATMDLVNLYGGRAANFLDIGGGAKVDVIKNGLLLVMSKPEVKGVLVNILGGITRCDIVADGIIQGLEASWEKKPVAVRMMGTNEEEGARLLSEAGIGVYPDMETATEQLLKISGEVKS